MNAEVWEDWYRRQGYHTIRTASSFWVELGSRVLQAFPFHWQIRPSEGELRRLLEDNRLVGLRYSGLNDLY